MFQAITSPSLGSGRSLWSLAWAIMGTVHAVNDARTCNIPWYGPENLHENDESNMTQPLKHSPSRIRFNNRGKSRQTVAS